MHDLVSIVTKHSDVKRIKFKKEVIHRKTATSGQCEYVGTKSKNDRTISWCIHGVEAKTGCRIQFCFNVDELKKIFATCKNRDQCPMPFRSELETIVSKHSLEKFVEIPEFASEHFILAVEEFDTVRNLEQTNDPWIKIVLNSIMDYLETSSPETVEQGGFWKYTEKAKKWLVKLAKKTVLYSIRAILWIYDHPFWASVMIYTARVLRIAFCLYASGSSRASMSTK